MILIHRAINKINSLYKRWKDCPCLKTKLQHWYEVVHRKFSSSTYILCVMQSWVIARNASRSTVTPRVDSSMYCKNIKTCNSLRFYSLRNTNNWVLLFVRQTIYVRPSCLTWQIANLFILFLNWVLWSVSLIVDLVIL